MLNYCYGKLKMIYKIINNKEIKLLFLFSLMSLIILTFLYKKLLFGNYSFIGPDSLSPQAIKQVSLTGLIKKKTKKTSESNSAIITLM